jgi:hypothetical protein
MFTRFRGRRPSAPMVISLIALFFAFGGVGYAAATLPNNSVGTPQLKRGAVTNSKIHFGAVTWDKIAPSTIGAGRINQGSVQTRVSGTCSGTNGAIGAVLRSGHVTCNSTAPEEFGSTSAATPVTGSATTVASRPLTSGTYLLLGQVYATNTGTGGARSQLTCTLAVPGGSSVTQSTIVPPATSATDPGRATLPLDLAATAPTAGATSTLSCTQTAGTDSVSGQINAIRTASNS